MAHRAVEAELIARAPAEATTLQVARLIEVGEDALCRSLGDAETGRKIPDPQIRIGSQADQGMRVVGEEGPASQADARGLWSRRLGVHLVHMTEDT